MMHTFMRFIAESLERKEVVLHVFCKYDPLHTKKSQMFFIHSQRVVDACYVYSNDGCYCIDENMLRKHLKILVELLFKEYKTCVIISLSVNRQVTQ